MKDPSQFVKEMETEYGLKLKCTGPIKFHLGCDFFQDYPGVLCMELTK